MTEIDFNIDMQRIEEEALIAHAKEELKRMKFSEEQILELEAEGNIVSFYGEVLREGNWI